jgi:hypothetical protein
MHRSRAPSIAPGTFFVAQSWADCITNIAGFNLRQAQAIQHADLVLISTRPDAFNLAAVTATIVLARQYAKPYVVVLNEAPSLRDGVASPMVKEARFQTSKAAELYAGRIWKSQLTHRNAIAYALNVGHALTDRPSYEAAYQEFERLWRQIRSLIRREQ